MSADDINPGEGKVALGFLEEAEPWLLCSKYFPSKVGGQPAWLALDTIPSAHKLSCQLCRQPLTFMCQLYLPDSEHDYSFHRTIFLFLCRNGRCCQPNSSKGIKAFRCQLPRKNPYYPYEPPAMDGRDHSSSPSARDYMNLCSVCGGRGDKACSQCRSAHYCSKTHQALHWKEGHKLECKNLASSPGTSSSASAMERFLFPEKEIILEPQDESSDSEDEGSDVQLTEEQIKQQLDQFSNAQFLPDPENDRDGVDSLETLAKGESDPVFTAFKEKIDEEPDQVIRYHRRGEPLFCAQKPKPMKGKKHICPRCSQLRSFEFQVMPQMLNHLKLDEKEGSSVDWGVLLVYTCHCDIKFDYVEEVIFKQDYSDNAPANTDQDS